jgi:predicted DNA-binding transcriptional regulator AlpA
MAFVNYRYLEDEGIMPNRMTLARSIEQLCFPRPVELGKNRIAWRLEEVEAWLASRPRRMPKTGAKPAPELEVRDRT